MKQETSKETLQYFAPLYILNKLYDQDGLTNPEKYQNDEAFLTELKKLQEQDPDLIDEISKAALDQSGIYDMIWEKVDILTKSKDVLSAKNGDKLENLKRLQSSKRKIKKKTKAKLCKCGCEMIEVRGVGGKITSECGCGCGKHKVKQKAKGGVLDQYDLDILLGSGTIESSVANK